MESSSEGKTKGTANMPRKKIIQKSPKSATKKSPSKKATAYDRIRTIIEQARNNIARIVNTEMVLAYWHIGKEIVEEEQKGKKRAGYGKFVLKNLSEKLTSDFGKGFDQSNLRNIRMFYLSYPKRDALRHALSWTHYRILMRIDKPEARAFYDAIQRTQYLIPK